jgi:hypothetical protein
MIWNTTHGEPELNKFVRTTICPDKSIPSLLECQVIAKEKCLSAKNVVFLQMHHVDACPEAIRHLRDCDQVMASRTVL